MIAYGPNDLQLVTGESIQDTTRVLSNFLDFLVIRTNSSIDEMRALASQQRMSVINAISENEHPTQAIADLVTIKETFGRLNDVHMLYLGEGNNSAAALAVAVAMTEGMRLTLVTPEGYGLPDSLLTYAAALARRTGAAVAQHHDLDALPKNVDVVYTTRWQTMGVAEGRPRLATQVHALRRHAEDDGTSAKACQHDFPARFTGGARRRGHRRGARRPAKSCVPTSVSQADLRDGGTQVVRRSDA